MKIYSPLISVVIYHQGDNSHTGKIVTGPEGTVNVHYMAVSAPIFGRSKLRGFFFNQFVVPIQFMNQNTKLRGIFNEY